jgi:virginiamycin B lyase
MIAVNRNKVALRWVCVTILAVFAWNMRMAPARGGDSPDGPVGPRVQAGLWYREFPLPTPNSYPWQLALDAQRGGVWVTEQAGNKLAYLDAASGTWTEYPIPIPGSSPAGLALDGLGRVWIAAQAANKIAVFDPAMEKWTGYEVPTPASEPMDVAVGQDGGVWFTEASGKKLGSLVPDTGVMAEHDPAGQGINVLKPWGIAIISRSVWFTDPDGHQLVRFYATAGRFYSYKPVGTEITPQAVVLTPEGYPWFTDRTGNRVFEYFWNTSGDWVEILARTQASEPYGIALNSQRDVWFTEKAANKLGRYEQARMLLDEYTLPTPGGEPTDVVVDAQGCIWYAAPAANLVGSRCKPAYYLSTYLPFVTRVGAGP